MQLREIAPEYYDSLYAHTSWCWVLWRFLVDPTMVRDSWEHGVVMVMVCMSAVWWYRSRGLYARGASTARSQCGLVVRPMLRAPRLMHTPPSPAPLQGPWSRMHRVMREGTPEANEKFIAGEGLWGAEGMVGCSRVNALADSPWLLTRLNRGSAVQTVPRLRHPATADTSHPP